MRQIVNRQHRQLPAQSTQARKKAAAVATLAVLALSSVFLGGCTWDSYMDPSVIGRWERTPTRVPILKNISQIEDPSAEWVEISDITSQDLIPETDIYRVGPGDFLDLTIWDLVTRGQAELLPRQIDQNGYIQIPQLGRIFVTNLTETEVSEAIAVKMAPIVVDPLVSVVVQQRRQQVFHLMGAVANPGPYSILDADYRILQALTDAGGFPEFIDEIYVIRQVPIDAGASQLSPENIGDDQIFNNDGNNNSNPSNNTPSGESLLDVIDDISAPGMMSGSMNRSTTGLVANTRPMGQPSDEEPLIDLIESNPRQTSTNTDDQNAEPEPSAPHWRFYEGRWVRESAPVATRRMIQSGDGSYLQDSRGQLFTQRVIRVPVQPLVSGDARFNVVIRPGDTIRVPPASAGFFYMRGEINRPGSFPLPNIGKLTLLRAIAAAGDLGPTAVPERVDLTRMVGNDAQATIMLNLRAIAEGTQPDIYIKRDDLINIGTKFWATPLAIIRGGFRTSYGFGFLLDRNFGNDVFGAPPSNVGN